MVIGLGLPWALALLPRKDWRSRPLVALVMLAVGPIWLTVWMFVLGTLGGASETALLTPANILLGTAVIALIGAGLAFYKWRTTPAPEPAQRQPLALDERLLITLIVAACVLRWLAAVWYPFWEYDPIWVYGYEGKLYTLLGYIPQHIGYYPQFLPLQYAYAQIMTGGVDDHAARAVFPLFHWGSILAAYALGRLNVSRRAGVYMAALWAMYPHVGQWATTGDLEIPLTFATTGAAAFFLRAWKESGEGRGQSGEGKEQSTAAGTSQVAAFRPRQAFSRLFTLHTPRSTLHYSLLAGLFLGLALWTKPTGGALILGVVLLVAAELVRQRFDWQRWAPRFMVAFWCGLACIPLGGLWYVRNILLGHRAVDFPHPYWLTQAMRSGVEFGWPLLAAGLLCAWLLWGRGLRARPDVRLMLAGWAGIAAGLLPSIIWPHRMGRIEWALFLIGAAVLLYALWPFYSRHATAEAKREGAVIGWGLLLALPYFAVWFLSYSYHYRLSFAIVPLLMLPVAAIAARWIPAQRPAGARPRIAPLVGLPLILACLPALVAPLYHFEGGWDYLWSNEYPNDITRLRSTNFALTRTVEALQRHINNYGVENPVIFAPGLQRLPFFFPLADVRIDETPTSLDQLQGVDYYVFTQEARWLYAENGQPEVNPVTGSIYRGRVLDYVGGGEDISFFGRVYRVRDLDRRFIPRANLDTPPQIEWPFTTIEGMTVVGDMTLGDDTPPHLVLDFLATAPTPLEYTLYVHLLAPDGALVTTWDSLPAAGPYAWYSTRFWETGEIVSHGQRLMLTEGVILQPDTEYTIKIGWYDVFDDNRRVAARLPDGTEVDGIELPYKFILAP